MKKAFAIVFGILLGVALFVILEGALVSSHVEAAPAVSIDPVTGLPAGAQKFYMDGLICLAMPNGDVTCHCP